MELDSEALKERIKRLRLEGPGNDPSWDRGYEAALDDVMTHIICKEREG